MKGNQRIELTKRLLGEGLLRLLKQKPLDAINVTELCKESGINRATFYRHYSMPKDVLREMQKSFSEKIYASYALTADSDISEYIESFCTYLYENADIIRLFIVNSTEEDLLNMMNDTFSRIICRQDYVRTCGDIDDEGIKLIVTYFVGGSYYMLRQWLMEDVQKTPKEMSKLFLSFLEYASAMYSENFSGLTEASPDEKPQK